MTESGGIGSGFSGVFGRKVRVSKNPDMVPKLRECNKGSGMVSVTAVTEVVSEAESKAREADWREGFLAAGRSGERGGMGGVEGTLSEVEVVLVERRKFGGGVARPTRRK